MLGRGSLLVWTIYHKPADRPDVEYLARAWLIEAGIAQPTDQMFTGTDLDEVRDILPPGLECLGRQDADDPSVVETWI